MTISLQLDRSIPVLTLEGRLDARGAAALDDQFAALPPRSAQLVLDMTKVDYLSSIGIRSLVSAEKSLRARHGGLFLVGLTPMVTRILETVGLLREFPHFDTLPAAVETAVHREAIRACASGFTIGPRAYSAGPASTTSCVLEVWGSYQTLPTQPLTAVRPPLPGAPIDVNLQELGIAFGIGGLGSARSQVAGTMGEFVAVGNLAGVVPSDGVCVSDFVVSDRPMEVGLSVAGAVGFAGLPTRTIALTTSAPVTVREVIEDLSKWVAAAGHSSSLVGFVIRAEVAAIAGSCYRDDTALQSGAASPARATAGRGLLAVGVFTSEEFHAHGLLCEKTPTLTPGLDDLKSVLHVAPETTILNGTIALYIPTEVRLGPEKRLKIEVEGGVPLENDWRQIIRRLYSDCSRVILSQLTGGYMATTFRVASYDVDGRRLLPTVLKITTRELVRAEEEAHRTCVQRFILNNSTTIMGTAVEGNWAALRYNFLGVAGPETKLSWLQDHYQSRPTAELLPLFDRLYTRILKPWYGQPRWEPIQLYADHTPLRLFPNVCSEAHLQFGFSPEHATIECPELGTELPNPFRFLKYEYPKRAQHSRLWYRGVNHGDLNPRNILVDEHENLYVIDFSETRVRNIVSDFARMETVVKFQSIKLDTPEELKLLTEFEQGLAEPGTIDTAPPNRYRGTDPEVAKAYAVICRLRHYANIATLFETDMVPYWLAALEWTYSVICYDLTLIRKKLAAYSAALICKRILELEP